MTEAFSDETLLACCSQGNAREFVSALTQMLGGTNFKAVSMRLSKRIFDRRISSASSLSLVLQSMEIKLEPALRLHHLPLASGPHTC